MWVGPGARGSASPAGVIAARPQHGGSLADFRAWEYANVLAGEAGVREAEGVRHRCRCVSLSVLQTPVVCARAAPCPAQSRARALLSHHGAG